MWSGSPLAANPDRVREVAPIVQEKLRELSQFDTYAAFLFGPPVYDDEAVGRVVDDPDAPRALESARAALEQVIEWDAASIEEALRAACDETGLKPRVLFGPVRVAVSGRSVAPGLFETPLHPYTAGLIGATPIPGAARVERLADIPGMVPQLADLPAGCAFAPRCKRVMERCRHEAPLLTEPAPGRLVACFAAEKG